VIAAAIPDAMLLPTDECFAKEVPRPVYDGLTCPKYDLRSILKMDMFYFKNRPCDIVIKHSLS
jgi:hypothetical protein